MEITSKQAKAQRIDTKLGAAGGQAGWSAEGNDPDGIRTRVAPVKGASPKPLDDRAIGRGRLVAFPTESRSIDRTGAVGQLRHDVELSREAGGVGWAGVCG